MTEPIQPDPIQRAVDATAPMFQVMVTVFRNGAVTVHGPVGNELLCLQILADGMREIRKHNHQQKAIEVPGFIPPADLKGNGH